MAKRTWKKVRPVKIVGKDCLLTLADGSTAWVDASDRRKVEANNWSMGSAGVKSGLGKLHHVIAGYHKGFLIDHIDGDVRNNRRRNLRHVTKVENAQNRRLASNNSTGFKGVTFRKDRSTFLAGITVGGRRIKIGTYKTAEAAALAYDNAARIHFGPHSCLNFPQANEQHAGRSWLEAAA